MGGGVKVVVGAQGQPVNPPVTTVDLFSPKYIKQIILAVFCTFLESAMCPPTQRVLEATSVKLQKSTPHTNHTEKYTARKP